MPSDVGSWFQQGPGNSSSSLGSVSDQPLTFTAADAQSVDGDTEIAAASTASGPRLVLVKMLATAANGVHINFGAAATTNKLPLEPGQTMIFATKQQVKAIKASGGAAVNVYVATAVL